MKVLPLICFVFCIWAVATKAPQHIMFWAISLYCLASVITVQFYLSYKNKHPFGKRTLKARLPHLIYEYLPFLYGFIALAIIYISQHLAITLCAIGLMVIAMRHLLCRFHNRVFQPSRF